VDAAQRGAERAVAELGAARTRSARMYCRCEPAMRIETGGTSMDAKRRGRPRSVVEHEPSPMPWDNPTTAAEVEQILADVEAPPIDAETRRTLQRWLWRRSKQGDGRGSITYLLRVIVESGNGDALSGPVLHAVDSCLYPAWVEKGLALFEAFDQIRIRALLDSMRDLQMFEERDVAFYLARGIRNRLWKILGTPIKAAEPAVKKRAGPRWLRPKGISRETWDAIVAARKARRNQRERANYAKRRQAEAMAA
jgi:hypothetical protein